MELLNRLIFKFLEGKNFESEEETYLHVTLSAGVLYSLVGHFLMIFFYSWAKIWSYVLINISGTILYLVCAWLTNKKKHKLAAYINTVVMLIYISASIISFGFESCLFIFFIVIMLAQLVIPYTRLYIRMLIMVLVWILLGALYIYSQIWPPLIKTSHAVTIFAVIFNINVGIVGILMFFSVDSRFKNLISTLDKKQLDSYRQQAFVDPLTQLGNRRQAEQILNQIRHHELPDEFCVAMMDIDKFKQVNDRYGHAFGDVVLKKIAETSTKTLRSTDHVFRWGGEEFLLLIRSTDIQGAWMSMEKLRITVEHLRIRTSDSQIVPVTVTIGLSRLEPARIEAGIESADQNMYRGKKTGRNMVCK